MGSITRHARALVMVTAAPRMAIGKFRVVSLLHCLRINGISAVRRAHTVEAGARVASDSVPILDESSYAVWVSILV